jgi:hypothetical protein
MMGRRQGKDLLILFRADGKPTSDSRIRLFIIDPGYEEFRDISRLIRHCASACEICTQN